MSHYRDYLRVEKLPHIWCGGCGNGVVLQAIARVLCELELDPRKTVVVTGIGCWGKADDYFRTNAFHGTHGRALAFATGIKLANPELTVLALMGDGDGVTIGGNHFIHAARRNVDLTAVLVNNFNYGMTGGQYSATTPARHKTSTSQYGHVEEPFDVCALACGAGASFVARETTFRPVPLKHMIRKGMENRGFSLIEAISPCPTHFGKRNSMDMTQMRCWIGEQFSRAPSDEKPSLGILRNSPRADYSTRYRQMAASIPAAEVRA